MLAFILLSSVFSTLLNASLSLQRIDAIADLCGITTGYFADSPYAPFKSPTVSELESFAWSLSEMWDENESALYVLTRLAKLVDEKDENGDLSVAARIIRTYSQQSDARKVYISAVEVEGSDDQDDGQSDGLVYDQRRAKKGPAAANISMDDELEKLYLKGNTVAADSRVSKMIQTRWTNMKQAINDLEISAMKGNFKLLSGLIKVGSSHRTLKFIAPELKAGIAAKFLSLNKLNLDPISTKWLLTMDTYREDQLKLVKTIEKLMTKRGQMSLNFIQSNPKNNLIQLVGKVVDIARTSGHEEFSEKYFENVFSVDGSTSLSGISETFYKKMNIKKRGLDDDAEEEAVTVLKNGKKDEAKVIYKAADNGKKSEAELKAAEEPKKVEAEVVPETNGHTNAQNTGDHPDNHDNYFEEKEKREEEIDMLIYENNTDPLYDGDGVYDAQEQERDHAAWIVIAILVGLIVGVAIGSYVYLRVRRARRNRTMVVVEAALEGTTAMAA